MVHILIFSTSQLFNFSTSQLFIYSYSPLLTFSSSSFLLLKTYLQLNTRIIVSYACTFLLSDGIVDLQPCIGIKV